MKFFSALLFATFAIFSAQGQDSGQISLRERFYREQQQDLTRLIDTDLISIRFSYWDFRTGNNGAFMMQRVRKDEYLLSYKEGHEGNAPVPLLVVGEQRAIQLTKSIVSMMREAVDESKRLRLLDEENRERPPPNARLLVTAATVKMDRIRILADFVVGTESYEKYMDYIDSWKEKWNQSN